MPTVVELKKTIKTHKTTKCPAISKMKKADLLKFVKENNIKLQPDKQTNVKLQSAYKKDKYGKTLIEKMIPGINLNKDRNLQPLKKEFIPNENDLKDMKKYLTILQEKYKDKKLTKNEYDRTSKAVIKQINFLAK